MQTGFREQRFPIHYTGNGALFKYLQDFKIQGTVLVPQPVLLTVVPEFTQYSDKSSDSVLNVAVLGEDHKDSILKNGFKKPSEAWLYVYFPYEMPVDDTLYKKAASDYESLVKEVPRANRDLFCKFVVWEQGKGDHSPSVHLQRLTACITREFRAHIDRRVAQLIEQHTKLQLENAQGPHQSNQQALNRVSRYYLNRMKLAKLYQNLRLYQLMGPVLLQSHHFLCTNKHVFQNVSAAHFSTASLSPQEFALRMVRQETSLLDVIQHSFFEILTHLSSTNRLLESMQHLRDFIAYLQSTIFCRRPHPKSIVENIKPVVLQDLWTLQLIGRSLELMSVNKALLTNAKKAQFQLQLISLKLGVGLNYLQEAGNLLFGFNRALFHPKNLSNQLDTMFDRLNQEFSSQPKNIVSISDEGLRSELEKMPTVSPLRSAVLSNQDFVKYYIRYLEETMTVTRDAKLKRIGFYLKSTLLRASIEFPQLFASLPEPFLSQDTKLQLSTWRQLELLHALACLAIQCAHSRSTFPQSLYNSVALGIILRNPVLPSRYRRQLLDRLQGPADTAALGPNCQIGSLHALSLSQTAQDQYQIILEISMPFEEDIQDLVQGLVLSLKQSLTNPNSLINKYEYSGRDITTSAKALTARKSFQIKGFHKATVAQLVVTRSNLQLPIDTSQSKNLKLIFNVPLISKIFFTAFFQNIRLTDEWPLGVFRTLHNYIYTPYQIRLENCGYAKTLEITNSDSQYIILKQEFLYNSKPKKYANGVRIDLEQETQSVCLCFFLLSTNHHNSETNFSFLFNFESEETPQTLTHSLKLKTVRPLQVVYKPGDTLCSYSLRSLVSYPIHVVCSGKQYSLKAGEQISTRSNTALMRFTINSCFEATFQEASNRNVSLELVCQNREDIMQVLDRFSARLETTKPKLYQSLKIKSDIEGGPVRIIGHQGYEMVGKVKGKVQFVDDEGHLDLQIVPIRTGKILLPSIFIGNKKIEWKNPVLIEVIQ